MRRYLFAVVLVIAAGGTQPQTFTAGGRQLRDDQSFPFADRAIIVDDQPQGTQDGAAPPGFEVAPPAPLQFQPPVDGGQPPAVQGPATFNVDSGIPPSDGSFGFPPSAVPPPSFDGNIRPPAVEPQPPAAFPQAPAPLIPQQPQQPSGPSDGYGSGNGYQLPIAAPVRQPVLYARMPKEYQIDERSTPSTPEPTTTLPRYLPPIPYEAPTEPPPYDSRYPTPPPRYPTQKSRATFPYTNPTPRPPRIVGYYYAPESVEPPEAWGSWWQRYYLRWNAPVWNVLGNNWQ